LLTELRLPFSGLTWRRWLAAGLVTLVALGLRLYAMRHLDWDYDEPVYMDAAQLYAEALRAGDLHGLAEVDFNLEHPAFVKVLFGAAILATERVWPNPAAVPVVAGRAVSAGFGAMLAGLVTLAGGPAAGLAVALHSTHVRYTSEVYLEAVPAFSSALAVMAYRQSEGKIGAWLWLSAAMMGVTAASKYTYLLIGLALAPFVLRDHITSGRGRLALIGYILVVGLVFFALNPAVWVAPAERLAVSLGFHGQFSGGYKVTGVEEPWWRPLAVLALPYAKQETPQAILIAPDTLIFALGVLGMPLLARSGRSVYVVWFGLVLGVLLGWPPKVPQYTLMLTVPLAMGTGAALEWAWAGLRSRIKGARAGAG
jgi:hypothetical protein